MLVVRSVCGRTVPGLLRGQRTGSVPVELPDHRLLRGLGGLPLRGHSRDIGPGLRTTSFKKRIAIAFTVADDVVSILGIFHGGRDYESTLTLPEQ